MQGLRFRFPTGDKVRVTPKPTGFCCGNCLKEVGGEEKLPEPYEGINKGMAEEAYCGYCKVQVVLPVGWYWIETDGGMSAVPSMCMEIMEVVPSKENLSVLYAELNKD